MPDYAAMYKKLFNSQKKAILILQEAQKATEEMYISMSDPELRVLHKNDTGGEDESGHEG